ncbi:MAG: WxcM-like domain-containing protein [Bacteroidetes bacterium]|nr:WxcM-like domain-containing protein [Bacteroidota bacterium]
MHNIKSDRGGHAHRDIFQVLIPISGNFLVSLSDGLETKTFRMYAVTIPRMTFTTMTEFYKNAECKVLANTHYNIS